MSKLTECNICKKKRKVQEHRRLTQYTDDTKNWLTCCKDCIAQDNDMMSPIDEPRSICYDWIRGKDEITRSEQEAKDLIDFYIARVRHINACLIESAVVKTEYEGYPDE